MPDWADRRVSTRGQGVIVGIAASGVTSNAAAVTIGQIPITARVVVGVTFTAGASLLITRQGSTYWVTAVATEAPALPPDPDPIESQPDQGDPSPPPKPAVRTGMLVCSPVSTATYRDGSWRSDGDPTNSFDTYQGRYGGSGYGRMTGCAFYGSKPRSIAGATITKVTVRLRRLTGGDYAKRSPTMRLVTQSTRPAGAPTLNESTSGPSLGVRGRVSPSETAFVLPDSWGQAMVNGTRGGLAISIGSDSPYIHLAGRGSWSAAWVLVLHWRKG